MRQRTDAVAQIAEAFLTMQRHGIVDFGADLLVGQESPQGIASVVADVDHVLIPNVLAIGPDDRQSQRIAEASFGERLRVAFGSGSSGFGPSDRDAATSH